MMRITLLARGTRGDVQPMLVLGAELRRRGHDVILGAPPNLVEFAERAGFEAYPVGPDSRIFLGSAEGRALLAAGNVKKLMAGFAKVAHDNLELTHQGVLQATERTDFIVAGVLLAEHASSVAESKNIPMALLHFAPLRRTRAYAAFPVTTRRLPGALNLMTWALFERVAWKAYAADVNRVRAWLGLPAVNSLMARRAGAGELLEIQAFSAEIVPGISDYGEHRPFVGFFFPTVEDRRAFGETALSADLDGWLSAGDPPAYFGFGSMPVQDPQAAVRVIEQVTQRLGLRALISAGWSEIEQSGESNGRLRVVGAVNHDAVMPRCRLAVHHGGSGTTAASAAAGLPTLVCSVFADQPFWGRQLARLGAGAHLRFDSLSAGKLERALRRILSPEATQRARALASAMSRQPNAAARAAELIEARFAGPVPVSRA
jgi:sterol 3beta-glucosyltransferase